MLITGYGLIKHRESCNSKFHSGEYLKIAAITIKTTTKQQILLKIGK